MYQRIICFNTLVRPILGAWALKIGQKHWYNMVQQAPPAVQHHSLDLRIHRRQALRGSDPSCPNARGKVPAALTAFHTTKRGGSETWRCTFALTHVVQEKKKVVAAGCKLMFSQAARPLIECVLSVTVGVLITNI